MTSAVSPLTILPQAANEKLTDKAPERFLCAVCGASYARSGHLRRHEVTHSGEKNFMCEFCGRRFYRVDIARRHSASCSSRGGQQGIPQQKRGKKRKACDACARSKIACDASELCRNCAMSSIPCTYFRLTEQSNNKKSPGKQASAFASQSDIKFKQQSIPVDDALSSSDQLTMPKMKTEPLSHELDILHESLPLNISGLDTSNDIVSSLIADLDWPSPLGGVPHLSDSSSANMSGSESSPNASGGSRLRRASSSAQSTPFLLNFSLMDSRTRTLPALFNGSAQQSSGTSKGSAAKDNAELSSSDSMIAYHNESNSMDGGDDWTDVLQLDGITGIDLPPNSSFKDHYPTVHSAYFDTTRIVASDSEWISLLDVTDKDERVELMRMNRDTEVNTDRLSELIADLCEVAVNTPKHLTRTPYAVFQTSAHLLLTAENVKMFAHHFFQFWQPHVCVLHPPTFDINSASLPLLLTVALVGSLYSTSEDHIAAARNLLDGAEEFVFTSDAFLALAGKYGQSEMLVETHEHLEAIQAAYLMCIVQSFNGTIEAQRHVRRQRFGEVVSALRALSMPSAQNDFFRRRHAVSIEDFDWYAFIQSELKVRTLIHIYLLDCEHAIFHNTPARFTLTEMTGHLACWDESFFAPNAMYCHTHALQEFGRRPPSLSQSIRLLLDPDVSDNEVFNRLGNASVLNLFLFINMFNTMIFSRRAIQPISAPDHMQMALRRWRALWEMRMDAMSETQRQNLGFTKNSHEYFVLAEKFLSAMVRGHAVLVEVGTGTVDVDDSSHVGQVLTALDNLTI
ncbi:uncharacterized protein V2V93DRAFT_381205 [Kockiozyma suomiensis]|uniref:uncharacterized protein n=1 Tax=Kockiozyma suomiensis TaxID=1337062 RepID=UPI003342F2B7